MTGLARILKTASAALVIAAFLAAAIVATAESMPPAQQNALVQKYCAVCHTDAANNGGLSLEHYDAARVDPPLAAMLLSKLRNGAMGAAGLGIPDPPTREAWVAATVAQAAGAENWTVTRADRPTSNARILSASLVREVQPRKASKDAPIYRLNMTCDETSRQGEIQLTWSPEPQTNRTFSVSVDDQPGIAHTLAGQEKMGNGTAGTSGRASTILHAPLPTKSLSITDLFEGETVVFPVDALNPHAWQELAACFQRS
jgi:mono/diheme cytochrome c family protein